MSNVKDKMHQICFPLKPHWGSLQCSPDIAALMESISKGREGKDMGGEKGGKGEEVEGGIWPTQKC